MRIQDSFWWAVIAVSLVACSSLAYYDPHWVMDPPNHTLRGPTPKDDRPDSVCDPIKKYDCDPVKDSHCDLKQNPPCDPETDSLCKVTLEYQCVVHTFPNYKAILKEVDRLQKELKACQSGRLE